LEAEIRGITVLGQPLDKKFTRPHLNRFGVPVIPSIVAGIKIGGLSSKIAWAKG
jgi:hypothetical protein